MFLVCAVVALCVAGLLAFSCPVTVRGVFKALSLWVRPRKQDEYELDIVYYKDSPVCTRIIQSCDILRQRYTPPPWGYVGHVQTLLYSVVGRFVDSSSLTGGERVCLRSHDGSTVSYNWYEPEGVETVRDEVMLIVPGIRNSSETHSVRSLVMFSNQRGYRAAVLNHVGCLKDTPLTGHRIFSYGGTGDLALVYDDLQRRLGCHSKFVGIGNSMGALILLRFLGEDPGRQENFLCVFSFCQLYNAVRAHEYLHWWKEGFGFYIYVMARRMVALLRTHQDALFSNKFRELASDSKLRESSLDLDGDRDRNGFSSSRRESPHPLVWSAKHIVELDEFYTRRVMGFSSVADLHEWSACPEKLYKIEKLPMVIVNARDDTIVPEQVHEYPARYTQHNRNAMFIVTDYGGHLGFFEGGFFSPAPLSWLDRLVFEYTDAVRHVVNSSSNSLGVQQ